MKVLALMKVHLHSIVNESDWKAAVVSEIYHI